MERHTMKKWLLCVLITLITISATAVGYQALHQLDNSAPSIQLTDVIISKPTIEDKNNLIFYGTVKDSCSLYYTASIPVTYHLTINNPNSPTKSANLTRFINDSEIIENLNIPPYATYAATTCLGVKHFRVSYQFQEERTICTSMLTITTILNR